MKQITHFPRAGYFDKLSTSVKSFMLAAIMVMAVTSAWAGEPDYVEIGGLRWATMNLGATTVAESAATSYGDYYAWGEVATYYSKLTFSSNTSATPTWKTEEQTKTDPKTHIAGDKGTTGTKGYTWASYCGTTPTSEPWSPAPYDASTKILTSDYDVANKTLGGSWRMPTKDEFVALTNACGGTTVKTASSTITEGGIYWITAGTKVDDVTYSVPGCLFVATANPTKRVFFPGAGYYPSSSSNAMGKSGFYWSSTYYIPTKVYSMNVSSSSVTPQDKNKYRYYGFTIRPVMDAPKSIETEDALKNAVAAGGEVKISADISLSSTLSVESGKTVMLDLNGYTLKQTAQGVSAINNKGTLTINNGTITGVKSDNGAVYSTGSLTLSSKVVISDNHKADGTTPCNLVLNGTSAAPATVTLTSLAATSSIGVTTQTSGAAAPNKFTTNGTAADKACFTPDNSDYIVSYNTSGYLETVAIPTVTTQEDLKNAMNEYGNVRLGADIDLTEVISVESGKTVILDLKGYTLKQTTEACSAINYAGALTISNGTITGAKSDNGAVYGTGSLTLSGKMVISGNYKADGTTPYNLVLSGTSAAPAKVALSNLAADSKIGVTTLKDGIARGCIFTSGTIPEADAAYATYFFADDDDNFEILYSKYGEHLYTKALTPEQKLKEAVADGGDVQLSEDIELTSVVNVSSGKTVNLDLNGHKLDGKGSCQVINNAGTLTITDSSEGKTGQITGGKAGNGGGINNSGTLTVDDGVTITGNMGGGIYTSNSNVTLKGKAFISGNTKADGTGKYNLVLNGASTPATITLSDLAAGSSIGVTTLMNGAAGAYKFTSGTVTEADAAYFTSDNDSYGICYNTTGNYLETGLSEEILKKAVAAGGDVKLDVDINLTSVVNVPSDKTVTLDLNGHKLDGKGSCQVINNAGTLTITDSSEGKTGTITGGKAENGGGINNSGTLTVDDGVTITGNKGGGIYTSNSNVTLKGKAFISGNTKVEGTDACNLVLNGASTPATITLSDLAAGSSIGVTTLMNGTAGAYQFTANGTANDAVFFTSDNSDYSVLYNTGNYLETVKITIAESVEDLKDVVATGGAVKLNDDIELTEAISVPSDKAVMLDLNGKTLKPKAEANAKATNMSLKKSAGTETSLINNSGILTICNGTITGVKSDDGAVTNTGSLTLSGKVVISGNYKADGTTPCNLVLKGTDDTPATVTLGTLDTESKIGVTTLMDGTEGAYQFTTNGTADDVAYFTPDNSNYVVLYNTTGNYLKTVAIPTVTDEATLKDAVANIGNVRLGGDISLSSTISVESGKTVILDLKGFTLKQTAEASAIKNAGTLTINNGTITGAKSDDGAVYSAGSLILSGKVVIKDNTKADGTGACNLVLNGTEGTPATVTLSDLAEGSSIGVTTLMDGAAGACQFTSGTVTEADAVYFSSDNIVFEVKYNAGGYMETLMLKDGADLINLLPGKFSVSAAKDVKFTRSNLYWDGSDFKFETIQTDYPTEWTESHVGHFFWTKSADYSYTKMFEEGDVESTTDTKCGESAKFFADGSDADHKLTVEYTSGLSVLSKAEWDYLFSKRPNAGSLRKCNVTVGSAKNCLIIAPNDYDYKNNPLKESYTLAEVNAAGLVCLPYAGERYDDRIDKCGNQGGYWSSTPSAAQMDYDKKYYQAQALYIWLWTEYNEPKYVDVARLGQGRSIRLVKVIPTIATDEAKLKSALNEGLDVKLEADIDLKTTSEGKVPSDKSVTLDLNDHTINCNDGSKGIENSGDLVITNGVIKGGKSDNGSIYSTGTVTLTGKVDLSGGTTADGKTSRNLVLNTITTDPEGIKRALVNVDELDDNSSIYVTTMKDGVVDTCQFTTACEEADMQKFTPDDDKYAFLHKDGHLETSVIKRGDADVSLFTRVNDYNTVLNYVLTGTEPNYPTKNVKYLNADANADTQGTEGGGINNSDLTKIVDFIYNDAASSAKGIGGQKTTAQSIEGFAASLNGNVLTISADNASSFLAAQMDIMLPEGVTLKSAESAGHTVYNNVLKDGSTRIVIAGLQNKMFAGNTVATITLSEPVNASVDIENAIFTNTAFQSVKATANSTTGVVNVNGNVNVNNDGKYIENNRVVIVRNGKKYNAGGTELR